MLLVLGLGAAVSADPAPGWEVRIPDKLELSAGSGSALPIAISVDRGLAISRDAALIIDLDTGSGSGGDVSIKRRRLGRADAVDPGADEPRFMVPLRADGSGDHTLGVHLRFWLCGGRTCRPIDVRRSVALTVLATGP